MNKKDLEKLHSPITTAEYKEAITLLNKNGFETLARAEIAERAMISFAAGRTTTQEQASLQCARFNGWNECLDFLFNIYTLNPLNTGDQVEPEMNFTNEEGE